jgi:hypothetical protein
VGSASSALTEAGSLARTKLTACLDKKGSVPRTCFEQIKSYYPVNDAERARISNPSNQPPKKIRQDYYFKNESGRLLKVITNERLSREEVLKRLGSKPVFKPGALVPPKLRKPQPPVRPMRFKPSPSPTFVAKPVTTPEAKPVIAPAVKPKAVK